MPIATSRWRKRKSFRGCHGPRLASKKLKLTNPHHLKQVISSHLARFSSAQKQPFAAYFHDSDPESSGRSIPSIFGSMASNVAPATANSRRKQRSLKICIQ